MPSQDKMSNRHSDLYFGINIYLFNNIPVNNIPIRNFTKKFIKIHCSVVLGSNVTTKWTTKKDMFSSQ